MVVGGPRMALFRDFSFLSCYVTAHNVTKMDLISWKMDSKWTFNSFMLGNALHKLGTKKK